MCAIMHNRYIYIFVCDQLGGFAKSHGRCRVEWQVSLKGKHGMTGAKICPKIHRPALFLVKHIPEQFFF